jgi:hypothetical protein
MTCRFRDRHHRRPDRGCHVHASIHRTCKRINTRASFPSTYTLRGGRIFHPDIAMGTFKGGFQCAASRLTRANYDAPVVRISRRTSPCCRSGRAPGTGRVSRLALLQKSFPRSAFANRINTVERGAGSHAAARPREKGDCAGSARARSREPDRPELMRPTAPSAS